VQGKTERREGDGKEIRKENCHSSDEQHQRNENSFRRMQGVAAESCQTTLRPLQEERLQVLEQKIFGRKLKQISNLNLFLMMMMMLLAKAHL
jgi:ferric-dicitrate binding protein FerR (iron transport regulator)